MEKKIKKEKSAEEKLAGEAGATYKNKEVSVNSLDSENADATASTESSKKSFWQKLKFWK